MLSPARLEKAGRSRESMAAGSKKHRGNQATIRELEWTQVTTAGITKLWNNHKSERKALPSVALSPLELELL